MISLDEMLALKALLWPDVTFYDKQVEIIDSWCNVRETVVAAGTEEGKDFVAGFLAVATPLCCQAKGLTFKLLTISVAEDHLKVLWGEIGRFLATSKRPLLNSKDNPGGPLTVNHMELRLASEAEIKNPFNYVRGMVYERPEKLQGHYADFNGVIGDEASGLEDEAHAAVQPMKRFLWIGNTNPCENFYREAVREGDLRGEDGRLLRKLIHITAWDSPNVKLAEREIAAGKEPSHRIVTPGVITWDRLQTYLRIWPPSLQKIKLRAEFPEDSGELLFPEEWLRHSWGLWRKLESSRQKRQASACGIDTAEGGNRSAFVVGDDLGVLKIKAPRTRDTNEVFDIAVSLQREFRFPPEKMVFDLGGGGRWCADRLRRSCGFRCQAVAFGAPPQIDLKRGLTRIEDRREHRETRYAYVDNRSMMYDALSQRIDPGGPGGGYALPPPETSEEAHRLWQYLKPIPRRYDEEGRMAIPDKDELKRLYYKGESPDEADALVLMNYGLVHKAPRSTAGAVG